jgi:hypothetical protein
MPSLRSLTAQLQKVALACATLVLVVLGVASAARLDSGQGLTVQVLRQTMGHRLQQNLRRPALLNARGPVVDGSRSADDETPTEPSVFLGIPAGFSIVPAGIPSSVSRVLTHGETSLLLPARALIHVPEARAPPLPRDAA